MGRRSDFARRDRDFYPTPKEAVEPLIPHLPDKFTFAEPCAGDGRLIDHIADLFPSSFCKFATDVEPQRHGIAKLDARDAIYCDVDLVITNTPWPRPGGCGEPVISFINQLTLSAPTWLLLPAAFKENAYFAKVQDICRLYVAVGRISWEGNGVKGKDDCGWYLFDRKNRTPMQFVGRAA